MKATQTERATAEAKWGIWSLTSNVWISCSQDALKDLNI